MERVADSLLAVEHELTEMPDGIVFGGQSNGKARLEAGENTLAEIGMSFQEWRGKFRKDEAGRQKVRRRRALLIKLGWFLNRDGVWDHPKMTRLKNGDVLHGVREEAKVANSGKHGNPVWYGRESERDGRDAPNRGIEPDDDYGARVKRGGGASSGSRSVEAVSSRTPSRP